MAKKGYPEILADMIATLSAVLHKKGHPAAQANEIAFETAEGVRANWGGQILYIGKGDHFDFVERDEEIFSKFDGSNVQDLAREYDKSVQHIYRILAKVRAMHRKA